MQTNVTLTRSILGTMKTMNLHEKEYSGSQYRTATTKFVVSRWYIPGGYMYDQARPVDIFFDNEEDATTYAKENEMPPEIAIMWTIGKHDDLIANSCKDYAEYKKRFWQDFRNEDRPKEFRRGE